MISIPINRKSGKPVYAQIRDAIEEAVNGSILEPGDRLPPVTALAKGIGVTPSTVRRALKDLTGRGYAVSHVGRGTFISDPDTSAQSPKTFETDSESQAARHDSTQYALASRNLRMGIGKSLDALMDLAKRPGLIHFNYGIPDPSIMRNGALKKLVKEALKKGQDTYQGYGNSALGMPELREELAKRLSRDGAEITPDMILITSGSQQAISIIAQSALENKQRVICETPCYVGVPNAFGAIGHWVESVPRDSEGPITEKFMRFNDNRPSIMYLCPELHNPMGTDISAERQDLLISWAREHNVDLISDEIFHDLRYEHPAPESMLAEAGGNHTAAIGSLSKSFMVGLRIGWLVSSPEKISSFASLRRAMDLGGPSLMQGIALSLLKTGEYDSHLPRAREHYRIRRDAVIETLEKHMPDGVFWTTPKGGFMMWVELPDGYSSIALFLLGIGKGVAITPGPMLDVDHRFVNAFRLHFGTGDLKQIINGVKILAQAAKELMQGPPSDPGLSGLGNLM